LEENKSLDEGLNNLSLEQKMIRNRAFYSILEARPITSNRLHEITGMPFEQVETIIDDLAHRGMIEIDRERGVVGSHGLSLIETGHRLNINGQNLFTWCAADAVGIPAALNMDALIKSECFSCKEPLTIKVSKGETSFVSQPDLRVWVIKADLGKSIVGCT